MSTKFPSHLFTDAPLGVEPAVQWLRSALPGDREMLVLVISPTAGQESGAGWMVSDIDPHTLYRVLVSLTARLREGLLDA